MKFKLLYLLFLACLFAGCSDNNREEVILTADDLFTVKNITFAGIVGDQSAVVEFQAPDAWTAEVHSVSSWLNADVLHGEAGKSSIVLSPRSDNFGVTSREATLQIYIDGYEAYTIVATQESASTGDITVAGHIDEGVMTLTANDTGTEFLDTIWVTSSRQWSLSADAQSQSSLSFEYHEESRNGVETTIPVIVKAAYAQFPGTVLDGRFYIKTDDGKGATISVHAVASVAVYDSQYPRQNEKERVSFNMVDTLQTGSFATGFYVSSNVRWKLDNVPDWIETASDWGGEMTSVTNVLNSGRINTNRQQVTLRVRNSALSCEGRSGSVDLVDDRGQVLKTVYLTFAGVGSSYISYSLTLPSEDPFGNPWGFEAKASAVNPDSPDDYWREISHSFDVTTSVNYTNISDAPFHMILVRADNGIPRQEEVHWARLEMASGEVVRTGNLYTRKLSLHINERGDEDDQAGITNPMNWRYAMLCLVPNDVRFSDLWRADGKMKQEYADNATLVAQKNNPDATYVFGFEGVDNGATCTVPAEGGSLTMNVIPGSYSKCDLTVQQENNGVWTNVGSSVCRIDFRTDEQDNPISATFTLSQNKGEKNPFTQQIVGTPRHLRVTVSAFINDELGSRVIYTFYIDQALCE